MIYVVERGDQADGLGLGLFTAQLVVKPDCWINGGAGNGLL
jgi:hypothetical protein